MVRIHAFFTTAVFLILMPLFSGCQFTLYDQEIYDPTPAGDRIGKIGEAEREKAALGVIVPIYPDNTDARPEFNGKSPFGVMIGFGKPRYMNYCSVSHIKMGMVLTATHCIEPGSQASDYYFLFFNAAGQKKVTRGKSFQFYGNADEGDVTLIKVDARSAEWDVLNYKLEDTDSERDGELGKASHAITLWSFDPSTVGDTRYMSFRPRKCVLGRSAPVITMTLKDKTEIKKEYKDKYSSRYWVYFDECDVPTVKGNSGGLISERDDFSRVHSVLHGTILLIPKRDADIDAYDITMPSGKKRHLTVGTENVLFDVGAPLDYINLISPKTL